MQSRLTFLKGRNGMAGMYFALLESCFCGSANISKLVDIFGVIYYNYDNNDEL
jgi:hypothetical protein